MASAPEFEWLMAAHWGNHTWPEFCELDGEQQSVIVAAYRCKIQMDAVLDHERAKELKRQSRRRPRRR